MKGKDPVVSLDARRHQARREVLEHLFRQYNKDVRAFLVSRMSIDEATGLDDVVQEVFTRLASMDDLPERFSKDGGITVSFLITIAHNYVVDAERRKKHRDSFNRDLMLNEAAGIDAHSPHSLVLAQQEIELVKNVILNLKPKWRQAFVSSRFNFKSYREIAADMGISVKQVEVYISKALYQVRKALSDQKVTGSSRNE